MSKEHSRGIVEEHVKKIETLLGNQERKAERAIKDLMGEPE